MDHWMSQDRMAYISAIRERAASRDIERKRKKMKGKDRKDAADALKFSILYRHPTYCEFILKKYGYEALSDKQVCCPLIMLAVRLDYADIVRLICKYGQGIDFTKADHPFASERSNYVDAPGCLAMEYRRTSLHIAVLMGHHLSAAALIQYGSDINKRDSHGLGPLDLFLAKFNSGEIGNAEGIQKKKINKLKCGAEILNMTKRLTREQWLKMCTFFEEYDQMKLLEPFQPAGIPSLMHLSRVAIRETMGSSRVPTGIDELEELIPKIMIDYLRFDEC